MKNEGAELLFKLRPGVDLERVERIRGDAARAVASIINAPPRLDVAAAVASIVLAGESMRCAFAADLSAVFVAAEMARGWGAGVAAMLAQAERYGGSGRFAAEYARASVTASAFRLPSPPVRVHSAEREDAALFVRAPKTPEREM